MEKLFARLRSQGYAELEIPPKVFVEMEGTIAEYEEGQFLRITYPVKHTYANPAGVMQGGVLSCVFDCTFGLFSYLLAQGPCVSVDLNTSFIRPVPITEEEILIEVKCVEVTKRFVFLEGKAHNARKNVVAVANTKMLILANL